MYMLLLKICHENAEVTGSPSLHAKNSKAYLKICLLELVIFSVSVYVDEQDIENYILAKLLCFRLCS